MSAQSAARAARLLVYACAVALVVIPGPSLRAQNGGAPKATPNGVAAAPIEPNYDLAAQWTTQKIGKLVFDTTVNARWLETSDRFWYAFQTRDGRRFYFVDAVKKSKTPLFDHAKMAAALTSITRIPYDAQHLPFESVRFVKNDTAFEFDVRVPADANIGSTKPRITTTDQQGAVKGGGGDVDQDQAVVDDAQQGQQQTGQRGQGQRGQQQGGRGAAGAASPRNRTLTFEYEMATANLTLIEDRPPEPRPMRWASFSPDKKTVVFARNHNLYMMDAENYEKARKNPNESSIVETQLTKDGEEYYSYARAGGGTREEEQQRSSNSNRISERKSSSSRNSARRATPRTLAWPPSTSSGRAIRAASRSSAAIHGR